MDDPPSARFSISWVHGVMTEIVYEYGMDWRAMKDAPGAHALPGATLRLILAPVAEIPAGETQYVRLDLPGLRAPIAGLILRRELVTPDGATLLIWDRARDAWTPPPVDLAPVEAQRLAWAAQRISDRPRRGRPPGSGRVESRAALLGLVTPAVRALQAVGHRRPTRELVLEVLGVAGDNRKRLFQKQTRDAGFKNWGEVLDAIAADSRRSGGAGPDGPE